MIDFLSKSIRKEILERISPTVVEVEMQQRIIHEISKKLGAYAEEADIAYSFIQPQGSTGKKQTQLKGASDIDLFVGLNPDDFSQILALPGKQRDEQLDGIFDDMVDNWFIPVLAEMEPTSVQKTYSQHPYLSAKYMGNDIDILLCFDLTAKRISDEGPITAVDRTIHHTEYVASRLNPSLREDVRILKSFIRASHAYGDTCAVGQMGFTGVSLELLVIWEKGLLNALKALLDLDIAPIDPLARSWEELQRLPSFRDDSVFIIDPTDTNRNIASSFSTRSYQWVKKRTKQLLDKANTDDRILDLIVEKPIPVSKLPEYIMEHLFIHEIESVGGAHYTIVRDKLYRYANRMTREIENERTGEERFGKVVFEIVFEGTRFALGFIVENPKISKTYTRRGPPSNIPASLEFQQAHSDSYEKDGYLWIERKRRWVSAEKMIGHLLATNLPQGLEIRDGRSSLGKQLANILHEIIIPLEGFPIKATV